MSRLKTIADYMHRGSVTIQEQGFAWQLNDEDKELVIGTIEKQKPKQPGISIHENRVPGEREVACCPVCNYEFENTYWVWGGIHYCEECGQAINWSEVE